MSAAVCAKCTHLFERAALYDTNVCARCAALEKLLRVADSLVRWHGGVDVVSGTAAADQLRGVVDMAAAASLEARAL